MSRGANKTVWRAIIAGLSLAALVTASSGRGRAQQGQEQLPAPSSSKRAEEVYKNIQVLKGVPSDQVVPAMQFITASLGVQCDFCHVSGAFEKDDLKAKQTARQMMRMMFAINNDNFKKREVTCYTCHRGSKDPESTPMVGEHELRPIDRIAVDNNTSGGPDADQIVSRYIGALGGADALNKISSRVEKGTVTTFGGRQFAIEVFAKAPAKRLTVMHLPSGDSVDAFDGQQGWVGALNKELRQMSGSDVDAARFDTDFYLPLRFRQHFSELQPLQRETMGDREAYVLLGIRPEQPAVKLYFDSSSGLLVRVLRFAETPLGRNPTQIDYADYRETGGVRIPYRWTIARPAGQFTIQIERVEQNVPIEDSKFAKPPSAPQ
jgi:photosynthetic reaction center cytochrome c subunit